MHDALQYIHENPMWRSHHHNDITFSFVYAFSENFLLPISHDEVVHGKGSLLAKMPGDQWQKLANVRAFLSYMWAHPGKQLLFMGSEFGQPSEWSEQRGLDWWILEQPAHQGLHRLVRQLNRVYREQPALWEQDNSERGFELLASDSENNVVAFLRWSAGGEALACVVNFGGNPVGPYRIGLPYRGHLERDRQLRRRGVRRLGRRQLRSRARDRRPVAGTPGIGRTDAPSARRALAER